MNSIRFIGMIFIYWFRSNKLWLLRLFHSQPPTSPLQKSSRNETNPHNQRRYDTRTLSNAYMLEHRGEPGLISQAASKTEC